MRLENHIDINSFTWISAKEQCESSPSKLRTQIRTNAINKLLTEKKNYSWIIN